MNNKGTDQPAHMCRLIFAFVVLCLDTINLGLLYKSIVSIFKQVSVAMQKDLNCTGRKLHFLEIGLKWVMRKPGQEIIALFSCSTELEISTAHKN